MASRDLWADLPERAENVIRRLDSLRARELAPGATGYLEPQEVAELFDVVLDALQTTLRLLTSSMGECRRSVPYSPLHPVIDENGKYLWCCNHESEHCVEG
jgi:hypothetical protein